MEGRARLREFRFSGGGVRSRALSRRSHAVRERPARRASAPNGAIISPSPRSTRSTSAKSASKTGLPEFLALYRDMLSRQPFDGRHGVEDLPAIAEAAGPALGMRLFIAFHQGKSVAASVIVGAGERVFVPFSATDDKRAGVARRLRIALDDHGTPARQRGALARPRRRRRRSGPAGSTSSAMSASAAVSPRSPARSTSRRARLRRAPPRRSCSAASWRARSR